MNEFLDRLSKDRADGPNPYAPVPPVDLMDAPQDSAGGESPDELASAPEITAPDDAGDEDPGNRLQLGERSYLLRDVPPLNERHIRDQHTAWWEDKPVTSSVVTSGLIVPTTEEIAALGSPEVAGRRYAHVGSDDPLWGRLGGIMDSLLEVVAADMEQNGLKGDRRIIDLVAGRMASQDYEYPHSDNYSSPTVTWTMALGTGSTIGYTGSISKAETTYHRFIETEKGKQLTPVVFPQGNVVRFTGSGDIHGAPKNFDVRILARVVFFLGSRFGFHR